MKNGKKVSTGATFFYALSLSLSEYFFATPSQSPTPRLMIYDSTNLTYYQQRIERFRRNRRKRSNVGGGGSILFFGGGGLRSGLEGSVLQLLAYAGPRSRLR